MQDTNQEIKRHMLQLSPKNQAVILAASIVCGLVCILLLAPISDLLRVPFGVFIAIVIFYYGKGVKTTKNKERLSEFLEIFELGKFQAFRATANPAKPNRIVRVVSNVDGSKRVDIPVKRWKKIEKLAAVQEKTL